MKHEIKFRGKRTDTREWVYGSLLLWPDGDANILESKDGDTAVWKREIDPDTAGQYTGLKDRNGKDVYDGDLLGDEDVIYEVWWSEDNACYMLDMVNPFKEMAIRMSDMYIDKMEVVGNRWDNPELLEVGK